MRNLQIVLTTLLVVILGFSCSRHSEPATYGQELLTQSSLSPSEVVMAQVPTSEVQAQPLDSSTYCASLSSLFLPSPSIGLTSIAKRSKSQPAALFSSNTQVSPNTTQSRPSFYSCASCLNIETSSTDPCSLSAFIFGFCLIFFGILLLFGIILPSFQGLSSIIISIISILFGACISFITYLAVLF